MKLVKSNNKLFTTKVSHIEQKVDRVLLETEKLLHDYRKKIDAINSNLESIKSLKNDIDLRVKKIEKRMTS